jgi:hypothetical protein
MVMCYEVQHTTPAAGARIALRRLSTLKGGDFHTKFFGFVSLQYILEIGRGRAAIYAENQ